MKTSSRKRLLVSSVAMLLVAMLALGTATFAWFTQNPNASASGLTMKATSANGLKILTETRNARTENAGFVTTDFLNFDNEATDPASKTTAFELNPASYTFTAGTADASTGIISGGSISAGPFVTTAAADNASAANGKAAITAGSAGYSGKDVYAEKIFCKLVGNSDANATASLSMTGFNVTWKNTSGLDDATKITALQESVRFIVTYTHGSTTSVIGAYAKSAVTNEVSLKAAIDAWSETATDKGYDNAEKDTVSFTVIPTATQKLGTVDASGNDYVYLYVYLDGEADGCLTNNISANDLIESVQINLSIA